MIEVSDLSRKSLLELRDLHSTAKRETSELSYALEVYDNGGEWRRFQTVEEARASLVSLHEYVYMVAMAIEDKLKYGG